MSSGIENWKICPIFTIKVPIGLRSKGLRFTTGVLVTVGVKDGDWDGIIVRCDVGTIVVNDRELDGAGVGNDIIVRVDESETDEVGEIVEKT